METYEAIVVGGGVVGTAIARELLKAGAKTALVEAGDDVGKGTSRANTALLHSSYDAKAGTLESRLLRRGFDLMQEYGPQAGIPIERTGGLLVAWNEEQMEQLPHIQAGAIQNNVLDTKIVSREEVYRREPHLGEGALGGLFVPEESIICPFTPTLAYATEFVRNGGDLFLDARVEDISAVAGGYRLQAGDKSIEGEWIINAAGLYSDTIDRMLGFKRFTVTPRRGELIVFDKFARDLLNHILLPVPTAYTKGVLISPTVFGNVLLGPTAEDLDDKTNTASSQEGIEGLLEKGRKIMPALLREEVTSVYAGLRAATEYGDYQIHLETDKNYICVGGIRSTGLSASMGIAEYVVMEMIKAGLPEKPAANCQQVKMPYIGETELRPFRDPAKISANPDYGRIVCHCEKVTLGEIRDSMASDIPPRNLDGLKRRTRSYLGRCQGFFCMAELQSLLDGDPPQ
jgi:glycerol-3-phosphate dehydrogenase